MKFFLSNFKMGVGFGLGFLLIILVGVHIANAFTQSSSTVTTSDTLTVQKWNNVVNDITGLKNYVDTEVGELTSNVGGCYRTGEPSCATNFSEITTATQKVCRYAGANVGALIPIGSDCPSQAMQWTLIQDYTVRLCCAN